MNFSYLQENLKNIIKQRNSFLLILTGLLISNILLSIVLIFKQEKTILIPPKITSKMWLAGDNASKSYFEEMSLWIAHLMLDKTSKNMMFNHKILLDYVLPNSKQEVIKNLLKEQEQYKKEGLSTIFRANQLETNLDKNEVMLTGNLISFVGDKKISNKKIIFLIKFKYAFGKWHLQSFKKMEKKK